MGDARKRLRIAAGAVALASVATQVLMIVFFWWDFDPRLSCDRLPYWDEWIDCLHGHSHLYILTAECAIATWIIAAVGMTFARFLPAYVSVVGLGGITLGLLWYLLDYLLDYWEHDFRPRAEAVLSVWDIFNFSVTVAALGMFLVGPVIAAWFWGLDRRTHRTHRGPLRLSEAFD
jgi:hypothetical protein